MKYLVTGGCGFIGSNFIHLALRSNPDLSIVNIDKLTYAADPAHNLELSDWYGGRYTFIKRDICDDLSDIFEQHKFDAVINFAAESHVDNSIAGPDVFVKTNITGAYNMLEYARKHNIRFVQISTDEVYGPVADEADENYRLNPSSPYSASKAAADLLVLGNYTTFKQDVIITRCVNNYGFCQHTEKLIPKAITLALQGKNVPLYGDGTNVREWIHVDDHCRGILAAIKNGQAGNVYNFGSGKRYTNKYIVEHILDVVHTNSKIEYIEDRKGHDYRYAVQSCKSHQHLRWMCKQSNLFASIPELIDHYNSFAYGQIQKNW